MTQQEKTTPQTKFLFAAKKNKPKDENQSPPDPDRYKHNSSKQACQDLLNDIDALLNGGGKEVNNPNDYKIGGRSLLPDGTRAIKSSIKDRIQDLKDDFKNLSKNKPIGKDSYKGHQDFVKDQQTALRMALTKLDKNCKNFTTEEQALIDKAEEAVKTPIPTEPDPKQSTNTSENQTLKGIINSIPGISQTQKDSIRGTIEGTVKRSLEGGKEYWEKTGKQQLKDTLDGLVKAGTIAVGVAATVLTVVGEVVKRAFTGAQNKTQPADSTTVADAVNQSTGDKPVNQTTAVNSENNSSDPTANTATPSITNNLVPSTSTPSSTLESANNIQPTTTGAANATSSTALTGSSPTALTGSVSPTALTGGTSTTALTGSVSPTALTGGTSTTALTGGETQQQSNNNNIALTA
jgi:hypothetical protein